MFARHHSPNWPAQQRGGYDRSAEEFAALVEVPQEERIVTIGGRRRGTQHVPS
jgi:hypothetical protein